MRVIIVDDSAFMRRALRQMLTSDPQIEVIGVARHGREGLEMAERLKPDVITLDIEMPEMDGLTALRHIMRRCPTQVLMVSSLTTDGSHAALKALRLGAADVLAKDNSQISLSVDQLRDELVEKVRALAAARPRSTGAVRPARVAPLPTFRPGQFDAICIGSSTGGPPVLETILAALPGTLRVPIVIAQHMPAVFTASMAQRLDALCSLPVVHVAGDTPLERGRVHLAIGGRHTHIRKVSLARWRLAVSDEPASALYRPSVDALFESAAEAMGSRVLAMVLTGMGSDGLHGGRALHERNATLLAQSEETCVVYGMPKAVTENALVAASLPPSDLARCLASLAERKPFIPAASGIRKSA